MAEWRVYNVNILQSTNSSMPMQLTKYQCGQGTNVREIMNHNSGCGAKMDKGDNNDECVD